ncbi:MAG: hypothetical protein CMH49_06925 [Myxococcales bacterium]|nr:hypothetical protein [Myxococcales bacterium]
MKLSRIARLIILITCLVTPSLSWAQHKKTQDLMGVAQKELMQGVKLIKSGQVKQAVRVLRRAYRVYPSPDILLILGKIYDRFPQGCTKSLSTWRLLADTCQSDDCPLAQEALARLKLSEIECKGRLTIKTTPSKAEVFIENQLKGLTPIELDIDDARALKVTVYKSDYDVVEHQVRLKRKWTKHEVNLTLNSQLEHRGGITNKHQKKEQIQTNNNQVQTPKHDQTTPKIEDQRMIQAAYKAQELNQQSQQSPPRHESNDDPIQAVISAPLGLGENPFLRLDAPANINHGKIALSAGRSMVSELRCQYRTRFKRYVTLKTCDASQLASLDRFYIALNLQQDAYVYVIMSNQQNQWQLIYPTLMEDHLIKANQLKTIPAKEWILLDKTKDTTDVISILASPRPIPTLEEQISTPNLAKVPRTLMRHFLPMSTIFKGREMSATTMKRQTNKLINGPLILHTSYRIYR